MKNILIKSLIVVGLLASTFTVKAQSTVNAAVIATWAWGTNGVATTTSGTTSAGAFGTNIFDGPALVSTITIANNTAFPIDVALFDAPRTPPRALYTNDVYTGTNTTFTGTVFWIHPANGAGYGLWTRTQALANITKITTNYTGVKTTNVFTNALVSGNWTNNQATNMYRRIYFATIQANSTLSPNLGSGLFIGGGLTLTNGSGTTFGNAASNLTISVNYDPSL